MWLWLCAAALAQQAPAGALQEGDGTPHIPAAAQHSPVAVQTTVRLEKGPACEDCGAWRDVIWQDLAASAGLPGGARVGVAMPVAWWGHNPQVEGQGPQLGDLRLDASTPVLQWDQTTLATRAALSLPTATLRTSAPWRATLGLLATARTSRQWHLYGRLDGSLAAPFRLPDETVSGHQLQAGFGTRWELTPGLHLGAELHGHLGLAAPLASADHGAALAAFLQTRSDKGPEAWASLQTALLAGANQPRWSLAVGVSWRRRPMPLQPERVAQAPSPTEP